MKAPVQPSCPRLWSHGEGLTPPIQAIRHRFESPPDHLPIAGHVHWQNVSREKPGGQGLRWLKAADG